MRWGWLDLWRGGPANRPKHTHTKAETIDRLPTFAPSFRAGRRGILPMRTFNVGEEVGRKVVQHTLTPRDGVILGGACIFDLVPGPDGSMVPAFIMVTTAPSQLIATVTDRMPALLHPEEWGTWLGVHGTVAGDAKVMLRPYAGELDMACPNNPAPRLI